MKKISFAISLAAFLTCSGLGCAPAQAANQRSQATARGAAGPPSNVSHTTKAVNYRRVGGSTKIDFRGTELMPQASGEAKVEAKSNRIQIDAKFENLEDATKFGLEYLTYVLWAVSPQGRAVNMGEVILERGRSRVKAFTDLQTFGMIVTAEPYFAVTQPGNTVVLENAVRPDTQGREENIDARFELVARGAYSSTNVRIDNAIFGIDPNTPRELFEARNALRIARVAQADKYSPSTLAKAEQQLQQAEAAYRQKRDKAAVEAGARETTETAEEARVMAVKQKAEEDAQAKVAAEKKAAEEQAAAEAKRRQEAEQERAQAEAAKAEAERMKQEAEAARAAALAQQQEAEKAAQVAAQQRADAEAAAQRASQQQAAAEAEAQRAKDAAARAEAEKAELRARLLNQLNMVLQTRDTVRGLIVNMSDVLFDTGRYTLKPGAREKLAKISGIVVAYPGLKLQVEGHTDSVGGDEFNQRLSEQRAGSVRDYLIDEGVPAGGVSARGFGKTQPVATNDTPEGRQQNRRVEIVVSGDAIGGGAGNASSSREALPQQ